MTIASYFAKPNSLKIFLFEIAQPAWSVVPAMTFYISTEPYTTEPGDTPSNQPYSPIAEQLPDFRLRLTEPLQARASATVGDLVLATDTAQAVQQTSPLTYSEEWLGNIYAGATVTVKMAAPRALYPYSDAVTMFTARVGNAERSGDGGYVLELVDAASTLFDAGLGRDIFCYGEAFNVTCRLTDYATREYQFHDGNSEDIVEVFDRGVSLPLTAYSTAAQDFDGTGDYFSSASAPTGLADGKEGTLSFWVYLSDDTQDHVIAAFNNASLSSVAGLFCYIHNQEIIVIGGHNSSSTQILLLQGYPGAIRGAGRWAHVMASWDLANGVGHLYIDGIEGQNETVTNLTNDTLDYVGANNYRIGDGLTGAFESLNGYLAEFWFDDSYLDLSDPVNRLAFYRSGKAVYAGADGSTPTGSQPLIYVPDGDFTNNLGSSGNWTANGSLTTAAPEGPPADEGITEDLPNGKFKLGSEPAGIITATVKGAKPGSPAAYLEYVDDIAADLIADTDITTVDSDMEDEAINLFGDEEPTVAEVLDELMRGTGGFRFINRDGDLALRRWREASGGGTSYGDGELLSEWSMRAAPVVWSSLPYYIDKNWSPNSDVAFAADPDDANDFAMAGRTKATASGSVVDGSTRVVPPPWVSLYTVTPTAATRLMTLMRERRWLARFTVPVTSEVHNLGDDVTLEGALDNLGNDADGLVIGVELTLSEGVPVQTLEVLV